MVYYYYVLNIYYYVLYDTMKIIIIIIIEKCVNLYRKIPGFCLSTFPVSKIQEIKECV